jgi:hypothetical protein
MINLKIDSVVPEECNGREELDKHEILLLKTNDELVDYMKNELKGDKIKDTELINFISTLLKKIGDLHVRLSLARQTRDHSPYYEKDLEIDGSEIVNGHQMYPVSGKPLFPKDMFNEFVRVWMTENNMTDDEFIQKVDVMSEKFAIDGDRSEYLMLPYPRQLLIILMLCSNKVYGCIDPRHINFFAVWIKRKMYQMGYSDNKSGQEDFNQFIADI